MAYEIACRCGECVVRIDGDPMIQFYCHCDDCQAASGGAYVKTSVYSADAVSLLRGELETWTLKTMPRHRCRNCGTDMTADPDPGKLVGVKGDRLPSEQFTPTFHQQCQYAVLPIVDRLPHYKAMPAKFGGSDELVAW